MNIQILREQNNKLLNTDVKYQKIAQLLKHDDCFFKIAIETAYQILKDLGYKDEEIPSIYDSLISTNEYVKQYINIK